MYEICEQTNQYIIESKKDRGLYTNLLGLVAETASLVRASGASDSDDGRMLAVVPAANPLDEPHHIGLFLPP